MPVPPGTIGRRDGFTPTELRSRVPRQSRGRAMRLTYRRRRGGWSAKRVIEREPNCERKARAAVRWNRMTYRSSRPCTPNASRVIGTIVCNRSPRPERELLRALFRERTKPSEPGDLRQPRTARPASANKGGFEPHAKQSVQQFSLPFCVKGEDPGSNQLGGLADGSRWSTRVKGADHRADAPPTLHPEWVPEL